MAAECNRLVLLSLCTLFGLPFIAAWTLALNPQWFLAARANYGQRIEPPLSTTLDGSWTLLVPNVTPCNRECRRAKTVAQVVRRALGAQSDRLNVSTDCRKQARQACATVRSAMGGDAILVVIDPAGNAMLRYGPRIVPRDLLRDVRRLLKASRSGGNI